MASNKKESSESFKCPHCDKTFTRNQNLFRHVRTAHQGERFVCDKCAKSYCSLQYLKLHQCAISHRLSQYQCSKCPEIFNSPRQLGVHFRRFHSSGAVQSCSDDSQPSTSSGREPSSCADNVGASTIQWSTCRTCQKSFEDRSTLYHHQMTERHRQLPQSGSGDNNGEDKLKPRPWGNDPAPWENEDGEVTDPELQNTYNLNTPFILAGDQHGDVLSTFNVPVTNNLSIDELSEQAGNIFQRQNHAFRINLAFGVILRHVETGRCRYFHPYAVDPLFLNPLFITNLKDLDRLRQELESLDIISYLLKQRPDTKWKPVLITNVIFFTYRTNFPLGYTPSPLPDYIKNHKAIISLDRNCQTGGLYEDHLCAFRCLALHRDPSARRTLEKSTKRGYYQWVVYSREHDLPSLKNIQPNQYTGLSPSDFSHFESCFGVNVIVFSLDSTGIAQPIYKSRGKFKEHMYLNRFENHLSLITNINIYCKRYQCPSCERLFRSKTNYNKHQRHCTGQTSLHFPGGFHQTPKTIFQDLEEHDLFVQTEERYFPWFVVFDFECLLKPIHVGTQKLKWMQEHHPISVSICSNVEGFNIPHCIVDTDQDQLIASMLEYMTQIGCRINELALEKWGSVLNSLNDWLCQLSASSNEEGEASPDLMLRERFSKLYGKLKGYCSQVPVLGFNSARYDLNIIKERLPKHLSLDDVESRGFTVKKNNAYLCQSNHCFKFLDVTQYLSPGTSYAKFLKAFGVTENKGFFPYEYLDCAERLEETRLPPLGKAWYSTLKQKSVLDDGVKSPEDNYANLEEIWRREGMSTFKDFLVWYNNLDVGPFVEAVEAMQKFYFADGIDLFKTTMSVPGVARQKLFRESERKGVAFALFDKNNEDLYHTIKSNVVGGPAVVFTRFHKAHKTYIRENPSKPCKRIVGYDANALYLWAIDQPMPTGPFVRRKAETSFRPVVRDRYAIMYYWMDWLREKDGWDIQHKLNWGREKRIGPYLVDGFLPNSKTVLEFYGCYFHGHECHLTQNARSQEKLQKQLQKRLQNTLARAEYIKKSGYELVEMWECNFRNQCRTNHDLAKYVRTKRPPFYQKRKGCVTEEEIVKAVEMGELFGMVEVDIHVPNHWTPGQNPHGTRLSPPEYFEEMAPLFCNAEVPFEVIGEHMQQYIRENNLSMKPRRMLVSGLKARQILIATPLLQWYLQHGMVVDRVYQVIEYNPEPCFHQFVQDVCSARREADSDPTKSIRGDTAKLTGNSAYGSVLINKEKHQTVRYVRGQTAASDQVNVPQFRKLTELDGEYFEVEKAKTLLRLDTPIQLGYFILQYAKLRMLQFYYDFMDVYVNRSDFEYMEMDTDSAYMALSGQCLADVVQPNKKSAYDHQLKGACGIKEGIEGDGKQWFPRTCCSADALYDKRTPGLFKLEYEGDEMIGLCSKTYVVSESSLRVLSKPLPNSTIITAKRLCRRARGLQRHKHATTHSNPLIGQITHNMKFSCKGISKRTLKNPLTAFRKVLCTRVPGEGFNHGFRLRGNTMYTYQQSRQGLSYLYCKRRVLADGIHTVPLNIELSPWPRCDVNKMDDTDTFLVELLEDMVET